MAVEEFLGVRYSLRLAGIMFRVPIQKRHEVVPRGLEFLDDQITKTAALPDKILPFIFGQHRRDIIGHAADGSLPARRAHELGKGGTVGSLEER